MISKNYREIFRFCYGFFIAGRHCHGHCHIYIWKPNSVLCAFMQSNSINSIWAKLGMTQSWGPLWGLTSQNVHQNPSQDFPLILGWYFLASASCGAYFFEVAPHLSTTIDMKICLNCYWKLLFRHKNNYRCLTHYMFSKLRNMYNSFKNLSPSSYINSTTIYRR